MAKVELRTCHLQGGRHLYKNTGTSREDDVPSPAMFTDPCELIDETLERLEALARMLREEVSEATHAPAPLSADARPYKEAGLTISILIPKLQAVRLSQLQRARPGQRICVNCDDL